MKDMITLDAISSPVEELLTDYKQYIKNQLLVDNSPTTPIINYIFRNQGKGIRPLLAMLSSSLIINTGEYSADQIHQIKQRTLLSAMLIEMIHTATLIHDDIIDEAYIRRGKPSINALWGSKKAVLIGDYIFARCYSLGMASGHYDLMSYLTKVMSTICSGELLQNTQSQDLTMTREIYYRIIEGKTASLIGCCSGIGALSCNSSQDNINSLQLFGEHLGMAFQIKDDILDFCKDPATGKLACNDIKERKITLPLLTIMENGGKSLRKEIIHKLSSASTRPKFVDQLYALVISEGGIEMSTQIMNDYILKAKNLLTNYNSSSERTSLELLCDFVASREK